MTVVLTGGRGLLGSTLAAVLRRRGRDVLVLGRADLDVTDPEATRVTLTRLRPEAVVHCAAFTAVDAAESAADEAFLVNRDGAAYVAQAAAEVGCPIVFPSTDYVFDGTGRRPYQPEDRPGPRCVYGRSKLAGEEAVRSVGGRHLIVRTSWLYGSGGGNFVDTMVRLATDRPRVRVVGDQRGSPTWTESASEALVGLLEAGVEGTYHVTDGGDASWCDLARATFEVLGLDTVVDPISTAEYGAAAPRPAYSVLDCGAAERILGRPMPHWRDSLSRYLSQP